MKTAFNIKLLRPAADMPSAETAILITRDTITVIPHATTGSISADNLAGNYDKHLDAPLSVTGPLEDATHVLNVATRYFRLLGIAAPSLSAA